MNQPVVTTDETGGGNGTKHDIGTVAVTEPNLSPDQQSQLQNLINVRRPRSAQRSMPQPAHAPRCDRRTPTRWAGARSAPAR